MEQIDRELLNLVQDSFPIAENPLHELASKLEVQPEEVLQRLKALKKSGYIRRLGGVISGVKLGYSNLLLAMEVPENVFLQVAEIVNSFPGVTHNYRRENRLNMWFTLSARSPEERKEILSSISFRTGISKIYEFPAKRFFKLNVFFDARSDG